MYFWCGYCTPYTNSTTFFQVTIAAVSQGSPVLTFIICYQIHNYSSVAVMPPQSLKCADRLQVFQDTCIGQAHSARPSVLARFKVWIQIKNIDFPVVQIPNFFLQLFFVAYATAHNMGNKNTVDKIIAGVVKECQECRFRNVVEWAFFSTNQKRSRAEVQILIQLYSSCRYS